MWVLLVVVAWVVLALPLAVVVGHLLRDRGNPALLASRVPARPAASRGTRRVAV